MKRWSILILPFLLACGDETPEPDTPPEVPQPEIVQEPPALEGHWGLVSYFDSIEATKEVARWRMQKPSWFGILLEFSDDSLTTYGSIHEHSVPVNREGDVLAEIESMGRKWVLQSEQDQLILTNTEDAEGLDSMRYMYRKRDDLAAMTQNMDERHKIGSAVTRYFNAYLLTGRYRKIESSQNIGQLVTFFADGSVNGIPGASRYNVRNYFGTLHPFKNEDVVLFEIGDRNVAYNQMHWRFSGDTLILSKFEPEMITVNGSTRESDDYIVGEEIARLFKME